MIRGSAVRYAQLLCVCSSLCLAMTAQAQDFPQKVIQIVVPFSAGGVTDPQTRLVAQKLQQMTGQSVIVDNKPGASTIIGSDYVAKSKPDGYTLLLTTRQHAINPSVFKKLPYDTFKDFIPITLCTKGEGEILVVNLSLPANNLAEFIDLARKNPGKVSYASAGFGNILHLAGEMFNAHTNVTLNHIPYKGAGQAVTDVLAGHVDSMFAPPTVSLQYVRAGRLRALGYTGLKRFPELPDVPTLDELGLKGYEVSGWQGVFAPAGTSPRIVEWLYNAFHKIYNMPDVQDRMRVLGQTIVVSDPRTFAAYIREDVNRFAEVARKTGLEPR